MSETSEPKFENNEPKQPDSELEDTREFTPEEVNELQLYAEWIKHRQRVKRGEPTRGKPWELGA